MVLEQEILPFFSWLVPGFEPVFRLGAILEFGLLAFFICVLGIFFGFLSASLRHGPSEGLYLVSRTVANSFSDLSNFSFRRTYAIARLAFAESIRNWALIVFVIFNLVLLIGSWFLDTGSNDPARLYLSVVMPAASFFLLLLVLVLSTFSLPADIQKKTIYTVVTKPVRAGEIVLGRILGFGGIGSMLLVGMALLSYVFVVRGVDHDHQITDANGELLQATEGWTDLLESEEVTVENEDGDLVPKTAYIASTTRDSHHRHEVTLFEDGTGFTDFINGHKHSIRKSGDSFVVSSPEDALVSRVPIYGTLTFLDKTGSPKDRGINVGEEWGYRSYIEGGTDAAAIWTFDGVTKSRFPDGIPIEMTITVFRSWKGNIEKGIGGTLILENPVTLQRSERIPFTGADLKVKQIKIPEDVKIQVGNTLQPGNLFKDLVQDGQLRVIVKCDDPQQYYGMAQADIYLRASDTPFVWNFTKGYLSIWLQMIIVTCFGVMFSTVVSGPSAVLASIGVYFLGSLGKFIADLQSGTLQGGGPAESLVRIFTQKNLMVDLDIGSGTMGAIIEFLIKGFDMLVLGCLYLVSLALPRFDQFGTVDFVASGYNIPFDLLAQHLFTMFAYVIIFGLAGYFFLRTREIAS